MKQLGVQAYEHFVTDGHIQYNGLDAFTLTADAKWATQNIAEQADTAQLQHSLKIHQQGQTDYPTFCTQAAESGVEKWIVNINAMTCTYFNSVGNAMLEETIPTLQ
jgi:uncharacterized protein YbcV (DUF1398 family)